MTPYNISDSLEPNDWNMFLNFLWACCTQPEKEGVICYLHPTAKITLKPHLQKMHYDKLFGDAQLVERVAVKPATVEEWLALHIIEWAINHQVIIQHMQDGTTVSYEINFTIIESLALTPELQARFKDVQDQISEWRVFHELQRDPRNLLNRQAQAEGALEAARILAGVHVLDAEIADILQTNVRIALGVELVLERDDDGNVTRILIPEDDLEFVTRVRRKEELQLNEPIREIPPLPDQEPLTKDNGRTP